MLVEDAIDDGLHGTPRLATETRPRCASVIWTIYLPDRLVGPSPEPLLGPVSGGQVRR